MVAQMIRASLCNICSEPRRRILHARAAQDFYLGQRTHVGDFIEKECTLVGELEFAFDRLLRAGKGAALVTEELALDQGVAHGRSVEGHK